ncbi:MAG: AraC family transcriptional regulator [Eubacteriales bacterium]|nr:AraC family transcriptional regulator [Eubacteriales bacterium]
MKNLKNIENTTLIKNPAYQETKRHSDTMFAFNVYPCTIPADFTFVPLHWQDSVEIIYIKRGSGTVQVDFTTYTAKEGDIFLVLPGHLHGLRGILQKRMEYENIIFDMNFLGSDNVDLCSQKYLQPVMNGKIQLPAYIGREHDMYNPVSLCLDASDHLCSLRPNGYELGVKGYLMILFSILMQAGVDHAANPVNAMDQKNVQKLKAVLSRIESDYDKKLTVRDIAEECGYSASHFMRWFKEVTGTGFSGYLIEYRLGRAAQALRNTDDSILEIAEQTGFDNLSNFNRLFKKRFEMTPSQFRKQVF